MTDDLDLFTAPPAPLTDAWARSTDPETAHGSADAMRGEKAASLSELVVHALRVRGPSTTEELADFLGRKHVSVSPRIAPLVVAKVVEDSGERRHKPGCPAAIVWRIKTPATTEGAA